MSKLRWVGLVLGVLVLLLGIYGVGVATAPLVQPQATPKAEPPADAEAEFKVFWEAWNTVDDNFVDRQALDNQKMTYGAIQGMLDSLGDIGHTRFLSPEDLKDQRDMIAGRFEGIGAEINVREGRPIIVAPIAGSPAERAGILAGDTVIAVDGEDTSHMTLEEVIRHIRGPKGTTVRLTVLHLGQTSTVDIAITRDEIKVPNVLWHYLPESQIAHIRIAQFGALANSELVAALRSARAQGAKALIMDVRNDPGGLLDQAVTVTSEFLKDGNVLLEQDSSGRRRAYPVRPGGIATDLPLVVLINQGTASAAEIFAGAIKDHERGQIIGQKSFGTGTVLSTFSLSDGSALLLATAEWLTPKGALIKNQGILPDVAVKPDPNALPLTMDQESQMSEADILKADAQLRAAVEALQRAPQPAGVQ